MPITDTDAVHQAAQHHAFAQLIRTDGWRLYMARLLNRLGNIDRGVGDANLMEYERAKLLGCKEHILLDMAYVYREAGEENPLEAERKAILARLVGIQYTPVPVPTDKQVEAEERAEIPRRSRRSYAGGVE